MVKEGLITEEGQIERPNNFNDLAYGLFWLKIIILAGASF
jgi:hypothetical protein